MYIYIHIYIYIICIYNITHIYIYIYDSLSKLLCPGLAKNKPFALPFATARFLTQLEIADISSPRKRPETLLETWQRFWSDLSLS